MKSDSDMRRPRGFTFLEMMVVLAIMAILAMATAPVAHLISQREKERELRAALVEIRAALDAYKRAGDETRISRPAGGSGYPPDLRTLVEGVPALSGDRIYFLRRIPKDPFADPKLPTEKHWGLRSYASSADHPSAGEDVYDVYSLTAGEALDGTKYREW